MGELDVGWSIGRIESDGHLNHDIHAIGSLSMDQDAADLTILAETPYLRFVKRNNWSFVERTAASGVVCIIAKTDDGEVILIEQTRPPVDRPVIEVPAGLAGDLAEHADEPLARAAQRELLEETGYQAGKMTEIMNVASCPGLCDEIVTFFRAEELQNVHDGGGDDSEDIRVHLVPLDQVDTWLAAQAEAGKLIDARVYTGLYFLKAGTAS